jgi:hypothetical protein
MSVFNAARGCSMVGRTTAAPPEAAGRSAVLVVIAGLSLAIGILVYLTDRHALHFAWLPSLRAPAPSSLFGTMGQWLPSLVHPFAFSLLTAAALPSGPAPRYGACVAWGLVNVAFEIGQHPLVSAPLAQFLQSELGAMPAAQALARYFVHGTLDPGDIVAALAGAMAAGMVLRLMHRGPENDHAR